MKTLISMKNISSMALTLLCVTTGAHAMTTQAPDSPEKIRKQLQEMITLFKSIDESSSSTHACETSAKINVLMPALHTALANRDTYSEQLDQIESLAKKRKEIAQKKIAEIHFIQACVETVVAQEEELN